MTHYGPINAHPCWPSRLELPQTGTSTHWPDQLPCNASQTKVIQSPASPKCTRLIQRRTNDSHRHGSPSEVHEMGTGWPIRQRHASPACTPVQDLPILVRSCGKGSSHHKFSQNHAVLPRTVTTKSQACSVATSGAGADGGWLLKFSVRCGNGCGERRVAELQGAPRCEV